jgi:2-dehydro-3-deoxyphosphogluconate aldolase/(4S)-4-hydroxy-2-oxoglutarate aldolase
MPVLTTMVEAGVRSFELTFTTRGMIGLFPTLTKEFGTDVDFGIGTITTLDQVNQAIGVGADYLVTPVTDPEVIRSALAGSVPIIPGGFTPTELFTSWDLGAAAVKVFPANSLSAGYVKDLRGPFPDIRVIPSGGVNLESAGQWLEAGAEAVSVGGPLLGNALKGGDLTELADRARTFVDICSGRDR